MLAGSGHIAGVVNPPDAQKKYGYWTNDELPADPDDWIAGAEQHQGSWWPHWDQWLKKAVLADGSRRAFPAMASWLSSNRRRGAMSRDSENDRLRTLAVQSIGLMDLTSLNDSDSEQTIQALCERALTPAGSGRSSVRISPFCHGGAQVAGMFSN